VKPEVGLSAGGTQSSKQVGLLGHEGGTKDRTVDRKAASSQQFIHLAMVVSDTYELRNRILIWQGQVQDVHAATSDFKISMP
jgi:hypothetical protein